MHIGVLGGTGPAGRGIATRLAAAGHRVTVGSRDRERASAVVDELRARWGARVAGLEPGTNDDAAGADLVVLATVWDAAVATAQAHAVQLAGKVVIAMANGLEKRGQQFLPIVPEEGSITAAVQAAAPGAHVVAAFQHVPAASLADLDHPLASDVMVAADDDDARTRVLDLVDGIDGLRALDAGPLANALGIETFAAALLTVNLRHKGEGTLRLEGIGPRRTSA
jgi:8-hydroxy-5-deazaflavin:NADPH oxidoreductase